MELKPKTQPSFFQQLHRDKTQRHSTITQRQNSNPDSSTPNTKLNLDYLRHSEKPNTKLKTQNSNPKSMNKIQDLKAQKTIDLERKRIGLLAMGLEREG